MAWLAKNKWCAITSSILIEILVAFCRLIFISQVSKLLQTIKLICGTICNNIRIILFKYYSRIIRFFYYGFDSYFCFSRDYISDDIVCALAPRLYHLKHLILILRELLMLNQKHHKRTTQHSSLIGLLYLKWIRKT